MTRSPTDSRAKQLALVLFLLPGLANAWGSVGHQVVAAIAARRLTPEAARAVAELLGSAKLSDPATASWADEERTTNRADAPWHYVNIPLAQSAFAEARDCRRRACVVDEILARRAMLVDPKASPAARREALLFLVHFVGDLHQPLHTVREELGGNGVQVRVLDRGRWSRRSLHQVWDGAVVRVAMGQRGVSAYAELIDRSLTPDQVAAWSTGTPADWANDAHGVAQRIFAHLPPASRFDGVRDLPASYQASQAAAVALQLSRAGVRLAGILNGAFATAPSPGPVR